MNPRAVPLFDRMLTAFARPEAPESILVESMTGYPAFMLHDFMDHSCLHRDLRFPVAGGPFWHDWPASRLLNHPDRHPDASEPDAGWIEYPDNAGGEIGVLSIRSFHKPDVTTLIVVKAKENDIEFAAARLAPASVMALLRGILVSRRLCGFKTVTYADLVDIVVLCADLRPGLPAMTQTGLGRIILDWLLISCLKDFLAQSQRTRMPSDGRAPDQPLCLTREAAIRHYQQTVADWRMGA